MTPNTPMTELPVELEPCPFCGGDAAHQTDTEEAEFTEEWIGCLDCGATTTVEVWNRRASQSLRAPSGDVVAWRWRQRENKHWIYDPKQEWVDDNISDPSFEFERLYASPPSEGVKVKALREILDRAQLSLDNSRMGTFNPTSQQAMEYRLGELIDAVRSALEPTP